MTVEKGPRRKIPLATYRLQFNRQFTLRDALDIVDYLRDLGLSDLYASPLFQAGPSSTHGYDVCAFDKLNPNLGGETDFEALTEKLRAERMGLLLDLVPNHMGNDCSNPWWRDVLAHGETSPYGSWFDIDWNSPLSNLKGKVLLPILEDHYVKVLEAGKLRLAYKDRQFCLAYYDHCFPLADPTQRQLQAESSSHGAEPVLRRYSGRPGDAQSFDALNELIVHQHYRLAFWRLAAKIINYRRFFDVTGLVAVRMELPEVFAEAHALVLRWCTEGKVTGLRVDHPDGLYDPRAYLDRLQRAASGDSRSDFYIVAEKILTGSERLPADWPVDGTTGYDFLNQVNGLFVNSSNEQSFDSLYQKSAGHFESFEDVLDDSKKQILRLSFLSELDRLSGILERIASATRYGQDFTIYLIQEALAALIAAFPVYRTYATQDSEELSAEDQHYCRRAIDKAKERAAADLHSAIDFIGQILLLTPPRDLKDESRKACREFVLKFQQLTGPVTAKGVEDTAFYRYHRLVSLNEVGGDPGRFGTSLKGFHAYNRAMAKGWPHSLLATATHDTKRGEDARARINVLSEMPAEWAQSLTRWQALNASHKTVIQGLPAPDADEEYLLYQTLIGAWPEQADLAMFCDRIIAYLTKALREAKIHTSWTDPNQEYEKAVETFIRKALHNSEENRFLQEFEPFQRKIAFFGQFNSLSQTLLKLTAPGVPDLYQGSELWDFSLVDPDNRRPVDFALRQSLFGELKQAWEAGRRSEMSARLTNPVTSQTKLFLIWRTLQFRKSQPELFEKGKYLALPAEGARDDHVCAFARTVGKKAAITLAPRLIFGLVDGKVRAPLGEETWGTTMLVLPPELSATGFRNVFTEERLEPRQAEGKSILPVSDILAAFPVALLETL